MKASEAMVADPHVAVAGAMASEVAIMLKTRNISVVPVVDDHRTRRFLGTLSDRDLVTRCLAEGKHPWHTRADSLMRTNSPVVRPDQELEGFTGPDGPGAQRVAPPAHDHGGGRGPEGGRLHQPPGAGGGGGDRLRIGGRTEGSSGGRSVAARR